MIPALLTQFKKIVSEKVIIIVRFLPLHDLPQSFGRRLSLISICFCFRPRGIIKISGSRENVSVIVSLKIADLSNLVGEAIRVICRKISKQNMWNWKENLLGDNNKTFMTLRKNITTYNIIRGNAENIFKKLIFKKLISNWLFELWIIQMVIKNSVFNNPTNIHKIFNKSFEFSKKFSSDDHNIISTNMIAFQ